MRRGTTVHLRFNFVESDCRSLSSPLRRWRHSYCEKDKELRSLANNHTHLAPLLNAPGTRMGSFQNFWIRQFIRRTGLPTLIDDQMVKSKISDCIHSWTSPMVKVCYGRDARCRIYSELCIGRLHECFTMYLNNPPKDIDTFSESSFSSSPFRTFSAEVIELTIITSKDP